MNNLPFTSLDIEKLFDELWPICRSISGNGLRESFRLIQKIMPLDLKEYPTGQQIFDWEIPKEWNIDDAYIITPDGRKICSFKENNLHIVSYSIPFEGEMTLTELKKTLFHP